MGDTFETDTETGYTLLKQELQTTTGYNHISSFRKDKDSIQQKKIWMRSPRLNTSKMVLKLKLTWKWLYR